MTLPGTLSERPTAVVFGAGSVGRGFLGQLFTESGYEVVFVDVDAPLVAALTERRAYTLRLSGIDKVEDLVVSPVRAVDGRETAAVAQEVAPTAWVATRGARAYRDRTRSARTGASWRNSSVVPLHHRLRKSPRCAGAASRLCGRSAAAG